jgi:predicted phosphodiesterase
MRFQLFSDLHVEYQNNNIEIDPIEYITPTEENCILAGDIGSFYKIQQLEYFLTKLCNLFKRVIYVPGNQEYYTVINEEQLPMNILLKRLYVIEAKLENLYRQRNSSRLL